MKITSALAMKQISELKRDMLNCNVFSVYDYDCLSMQELLCTFFTKINQCIDVTNKTVVLVDWLVNQGLAENVAKQLEKWLVDGTLANIINETVFNDLSTKLRVLTSRVDVHDAKLNAVSKTFDNRGFLNVKDLGAYGDGQSHPLSTRFTTLEDAKRVYPDAVTLGEEIDRLAIQKALNSGKACYIPTGDYLIDKQLNVTRATEIYGDGRKHTILKGIMPSGNMFFFNENSHRSSFEKIGVFGNLKNDLVTGSNNQLVAFYVDAPYINFNDFEIHNFKTVIHFVDRKCFVHRVTKGFIVYCNEGIRGNVEFNDIFINMCNITYCKTGIFKGEGRSVTIIGNDIERNDISVQVANTGDLNIIGNYFELEKECAIDIIWASSSVDRVNISNNSFFSETNPSNFIRYHGKEGAIVTVENNMFVGSTGIDKTIKVFIKGNGGTLCKPRINNNYLNDKCIYGVDAEELQNEEFINTTLGNHLVQETTTNLSGVDVNKTRGVRITYGDGQQITLPSFSNLFDPRKCFKLVAFGTGSSNMTINTTGHEVIGLSTIEPNQMYSIYFNRMSGSKEEVLICKG